jgi:hypothetical protein
MKIELNVEPRKVYTWKEFRKQKPRFSIALDGFVADSTKRDSTGPYANFDHHFNADRLATRSTSEQVHMEINMGLFDAFKKDGIPTANVYVNDPDEDTSLAVWLLKNNELVINHAEPQINRLVYCEDRLDCTAGAYPFGDTKMRRKMAWIFEPYNNARFNKKLHQMDESGMKTIIESVDSRITNHIFGEGGEIPLEGNYEKIGGGDGWVMVKETGPASRLAMYNDGISAYVALVTKKTDGSFVYVLGRKSVWTSFDIPKLYKILNKEEGVIGENNSWGGSNTIGGSPRSTGSKIDPKSLQKIINTIV